MEKNLKNSICVCMYVYIYITESFYCALNTTLQINNTSIKKKAMAPHSSTLAWKIPWAEEPGRLRSMGSLRVGTTE